jgi:hypothetical protein
MEEDFPEAYLELKAKGAVLLVLAKWERLVSLAVLLFAIDGELLRSCLTLSQPEVKL